MENKQSFKKIEDAWTLKVPVQENATETVKDSRNCEKKCQNKNLILPMLVIILVAGLLITIVIFLMNNEVSITIKINPKRYNNEDENHTEIMLAITQRYNSEENNQTDNILVDPKRDDNEEENRTENIMTSSSFIDTTTAEIPSNGLKLISRLEWLAQPAAETPNPLAGSVPYVIIHQTASVNCSTQKQCILQTRFIQNFHIENKNWWDIGYNFLVGGDGAAYEGRGWKSKGAHTYGFNSKSIGIAFIGTFNSIKPPQKQIEACKQLIEKGVEMGYIQKEYKLLAAKQLVSSTSPGSALYEDVKTWDHWTKTP